VIKAAENPDLAGLIGHTVITSDGTTLLGSDDKAGIAAILTLVDHLLAHPEIKHGPLRIGFNPDEETGQGTLHLDVAKVKADYAYTVDGGHVGEIENETFNAAAAEVRITGFNVHPGYAKDKMVNAIKIAARLVGMLPAELCPEKTEKRQGYIHPLHMTGDVGQASVKFILRDFEWPGIEEKVKILEHIVALLKIEHPRAVLELSWKEQYRNMRFHIDKDPRVVDHALEAVRRMG